MSRVQEAHTPVSSMPPSSALSCFLESRRCSVSSAFFSAPVPHSSRITWHLHTCAHAHRHRQPPRAPYIAPAALSRNSVQSLYYLSLHTVGPARSCISAACSCSAHLHSHCALPHLSVPQLCHPIAEPLVPRPPSPFHARPQFSAGPCSPGCLLGVSLGCTFSVFVPHMYTTRSHLCSTRRPGCSRLIG
jgi:hypothetical protein